MQRFSSSAGQFRTVMGRKIARSCAENADQDINECSLMLETLIQKFLRAGLLNDEIYAQQTVASLRRRGASSSAIKSNLRKKGVDPAKAHAAIRQHDEMTDTENSELLAAIRFAKRKKLGPFSAGEKTREKSMSAYARGGFNYETARRVLNMDAKEALKITEGFEEG